MVVRKHFTITLENDLISPVWSFKEAGGYISMSSAICSLVRMALSADPEDALLKSGKRQAYNEARQWSFTSLAAHFRQMAELLELSK